MKFLSRLVLVAMLVSLALAAQAACRIRSLGETKSAFLSALRPHLSKLGMVISSSTDAGPKTQYIFRDDPRVELVLRDEDGLLVEVGASLLTPASRADEARAVDLVAFSIAHFSARSAETVKDELFASLARHAGLASWFEQWGADAVAITRSDDGLVMKTGKLDCS